MLAYIRAKIDGEKDLPTINPWVRGFVGKINSDHKDSYSTKGVITKTSDSSVSITELPVGVWTNSYKKYLVHIMKKGKIQSFTENHTTMKVSYDVRINASELEKMWNGDIYKSFKLQNELSTGK